MLRKQNALFLLMLSILAIAVALTPSCPQQRCYRDRNIIVNFSHFSSDVSDSKNTLAVPKLSMSQSQPCIVFPGGGIFFYWQAGVVTYLREKNYDMNEIIYTGASAGALVATLACADVDFYKATELALEMARRGGVWDRKQKLQGIWGPMIEDWLNDMLPDDAAEKASKRLSLLVTRIPSFRKERVTHFWDKNDLIQCNMASVHLPWFLNGKLTTRFRNRRYIDGSFFAKTKHYLCGGDENTLILDYKQDLTFKRRGMLDFVEALSPEGIYALIEDGRRYAQTLEELGKFQLLKVN